MWRIANPRYSRMQFCATRTGDFGALVTARFHFNPAPRPPRIVRRPWTPRVILPERKCRSRCGNGSSMLFSRNLRSIAKYSSLRKRVGLRAMSMVQTASSKFNELSPNARNRTEGPRLLENGGVRFCNLQQHAPQLLYVAAIGHAERQPQAHFRVAITPVRDRVRDEIGVGHDDGNVVVREDDGASQVDFLDLPGDPADFDAMADGNGGVPPG